MDYTEAERGSTDAHKGSIDTGKSLYRKQPAIRGGCIRGSVRGGGGEKGRGKGGSG